MPLRFGFLGAELFKTGDRLTRDQRTAMQANEALGKLFFQLGQRFVEQVLAAGSARRHVLEVGFQVENVGQRNQQQTPALMTRKMRARRLRQGRQTLGQRRLSLPRLLKGSDETRQAHRLEQVIDGVEFEGLDGITVVGGDENHCRRLCEPPEMAGELDAIHHRHADVHEHNVELAQRL